MSRFTSAQRERVLAEARANIQRREREPMPVERREGHELIYKTHDNDAPRAHTASDELPWWQWVERVLDARLAATGEATGEVLGQFHDEALREVSTLRHELECLRREVTALREQVGLERGLRDLRSEVEAARAQVPEFPKIAEDLAAGQARFRREVETTKEKLGRVRVDQSVTRYRLEELSKARVVDKSKTSERLEELRQANEATEAKIEIIFPRHKIHPDAGAALRNYAAEALKGETVYCLIHLRCPTRLTRPSWRSKLHEETRPHSVCG